MRRVLTICAVTALATSACSGAPEPGKPAEDDIEELAALVNVDAGDASANDAVNAERLRALQARLEKLKARTEAQKARLAVLKEEAAKRRARHVEPLSLGENLAIAAIAIAIALAAIASRERKRESVVAGLLGLTRRATRDLGTCLG
jgi:hypothetical protein